MSAALPSVWLSFEEEPPPLYFWLNHVWAEAVVLQAQFLVLVVKQNLLLRSWSALEREAEAEAEAEP